MSKKTENYLLILIWLLFLIPWSGKEYFPNIFGNYIIQWSMSLFVAILIPIGVLSCLNKMTINDKKEKMVEWWRLFGFVFPLIIIITTHNINYMLQTKVISLSKDDPMPLSRVIQMAQNSKIEKDSQLWAKFAFTQFGVKIAYNTQDGKIKIYEPSKNDLAEQEKNLTKEKQAKYSIGLIKGYQNQSFYIMTLYFSCFIIIILIGLFINIFKPISV